MSTSIVGEEAINVYRAVVLRSSIKLYQKTKIIPTRGCTITHMLRLTQEITGHGFKRTELDGAIAALDDWILKAKEGLGIQQA